MDKHNHLSLLSTLNSEMEKLRVALRNRTKALNETKQELSDLKTEYFLIKAKYEMENIELPLGRLG